MQNLCNDKMKLNKFIRVDLPSNKVLFQRCSGIVPKHGTTEIPSADFTSRNLDAIASAQREVYADYAQELRDNQMPLDTDIDSSTKSKETSENDN